MLSLIQFIVEKTLGKSFIEPHPYDLNLIYEESTNQIPIIFILSSGIKKIYKNINILFLTLNFKE